MNEPNFEEYSLESLEDILSNIDQTKWPERVKKVKALIKSKSEAHLNEVGEKQVEIALVEKSNAVNLFSPKQIFVGSFLCGPVAALYYLKFNFKNMNKDLAESWTLYSGIGFIILLTVSLAFLPDNFPKQILPIFYSGIALMLSEKFQINKEKEAVSEEYQFCSNWLVLKIGIISFIFYVVFAFGLLYVIL